MKTSDVLERMAGFPVFITEAIPKGEVWFMQDGKIVGKIIEARELALEAGD